MKFSEKELEDLVVSWIVLGISFAVFRLGVSSLVRNPILIVQMLIIVGSAFVLHELSHKYVAQKYGLWAEYRKYTWGLVLAFFLGVTRFIFFAAPGAVVIMSTGWVTREIEGKTSLAGPVCNIAVGVTALLLRYAGMYPGFLTELAMINLFLAVFNLLPVPPMDGSKIIRYNPLLWTGVFISAGLLLFISF
ncbi:MAG: site-2 protease family protein [Theionarchaea archaeon]|nr:site-2 protease family protein [Theionarchaea archaeon]MBU6999285.1 site-2 protease family protein [Theionarchaea archaeon]MBU7019590.1 site-2 protease family protein [Theionarchaea archaeon]MBU7033769.1 site-2 protease family protein [Theionarchaea archaeon]MBU7039421.1 site-2 protease family protein [Theionarchaea archaeon]